MSHRVVLYTQPDCTLCDEARAMLERLGHGYSEAFDARYALRVPVVEVNGRVVAEAPVDERVVRRALRRRLVRRGRKQQIRGQMAFVIAVTSP